MASRRAFLRTVLLVLAAAAAPGPAAAGRGLRVIGKGMSMMTQAVAVAAPISLQPIYPQNVIMAPVYTQPMMYGGAAYPQQPVYPQQPAYQQAAPAQAVPVQEPMLNPLINKITKFLDGKDSSSDDPVYTEPSSTSYSRLRSASDSSTSAAAPALKLDFTPPGSASDASKALLSLGSSLGMGKGSSAPADDQPREFNVAVPAVNLTIPDKFHVLKNTARTFQDALAVARDEITSRVGEAKSDLSDALKRLKKSPAPAVAAAQTAPVVVVQPVPATTIVPVVSTSIVRPTYYTHKGPGKGFFGK